MTERLTEWAEQRGYRVAWAPTPILDTVRAELEGRLASGEIDRAFADEFYEFDFTALASLPEPTVLVVVVPRPAHRVAFRVNGRRVEALLPPTYQRYRPVFREVRAELLAGPLAGERVEAIDEDGNRVCVPLKALAVRLGLVRYGRNNLTFAEGIGSYLQLCGFLTSAALDLPIDWRPAQPRLLDRCLSCRACGKLCPTGAIGKDRTLLHVERCLTGATEVPGPWPSWVPSSSHHCLIGCLRCQQSCPANPRLAVVDSGVEFGEDETATLMAYREESPRTTPAWDGIREKLAALGQPYREEVIGRNLQALLAANGSN